MSRQQGVPDCPPGAPRVLNVLVSADAAKPRREFDRVLPNSQLHDVGRELPSRYYSAIRTTAEIVGLSTPALSSWFAECARAIHPFGSMEVLLLDNSERSPAARALVRVLDGVLRETGFAPPEWHLTTETLSSSLAPQSGGSFAGYAVASRKPAYYHDCPFSDDEFTARCDLFRASGLAGRRAATYIVPTFDEAKALPRFLDSLSRTRNTFGTDREFIFVLSGCTDDSGQIIRQHIGCSAQDMRVVESGRGIVTALRRGVESRRLDGFVGKIDADVVVHPHALDLMERCLVENGQARVTYAEPLTHDEMNPFNALSHHPEFATRRNYYTGKTSLYRCDPFAEPVMSASPEAVFATEDVPLSFNFAYYYGLSSIVRAPGACVFEKTVANFDDFSAQVWRAECEIARVLQAAPHFSKLLPAMRQDVTDKAFRELIQEAMSVPRSVSDWTRLESTK
jgi:hypothetical protein